MARRNLSTIQDCADGLVLGAMPANGYFGSSVPIQS